MKNLRIFGMHSTQKYAESVADYLDINLTRHIEKYFPDKEPYLRAEENVRGCDVYVVQSLYTDENETVNDKFIKLLYLIGSLKDASADRVTAVIPYFGYQRQDRKTESRAPITTKYVAMLLEAVGVNRVLSMDVHNLSVFQNSIRIPTDHLEAKNLIVDYIAKQLKERGEDMAVLAPDSGGAGRAERFRKSLTVKLNKKVDLVHLDKVREGSVVHGTTISNDVRGKLVIVVDDMIASGSTLAKCAETVEKAGGILWAACATHGLMVGEVNSNLAKLNKIIITDTIEQTRLSNKVKEKTTILSTTKLFARAIRRIHDEGGSISDLLR